MIDAELAGGDIRDRDGSPPAWPADCELGDWHGISLTPGEPLPIRLRRQYRRRRSRGTAERRVDHRRSAAVRECRVGQHVPRSSHCPRVLDFTAGVSAVLTLQGAGVAEICAATLWWTIVVLRDGRRCRSWRADVAQLVAHHLAKVRVAGSNPVIRSKVQWHQSQRWSGRVVRQRPAKPCTRVRFPSPPPRRTPRD